MSHNQAIFTESCRSWSVHISSYAVHMSFSYIIVLAVLLTLEVCQTIGLLGYDRLSWKLTENVYNLSYNFTDYSNLINLLLLFRKTWRCSGTRAPVHFLFEWDRETTRAEHKPEKLVQTVQTLQQCCKNGIGVFFAVISLKCSFLLFSVLIFSFSFSFT